MSKRLRRKTLGLIALGWREKKYGAPFTWLFGMPSAIRAVGVKRVAAVTRPYAHTRPEEV